MRPPRRFHIRGGLQQYRPHTLSPNSITTRSGSGYNDIPGFPSGHVRLHMLRHTYAAARVQTCDRGRPVALYTVARELGHASTDMLEDRYAHLHDRVEEGATEVVEFRVEDHMERVGDRLAAMAVADAETN